MELPEIATLTAVALALAFANRAFVEYTLGYAADTWEKLAPVKKFLPYVALMGGIGLAFWYQLDFVAWMLSKAPDGVGVFISGTLIGQGAEVVHKFVFEYVLRDRVRENE